MTKTKRILAQKELLSVELLRATLAEMKKRASEATRELGKLEADLRSALLDGATVEKGKLIAFVKMEAGRCAPEWKGLYLGHMSALHGVDNTVAENEARAAYPPMEHPVLYIEKPATTAKVKS